MLDLSSRRWIAMLLAGMLSCPILLAQRTGNKLPGLTNIPPAPAANSNPNQFRPLYVSGSVVMQGGITPPEPIAIERVCNGVARREGYTDFRGHFQIELTSTSSQYQDVSESNSNETGNSLPGKTTQSNQFRFEGCELRAVLPGFQSTSLVLHITDDFGDVRVGNITLAPMGNVVGSTISMTGLAAPESARRAFEKGRKAEAQKKYDEAEKHLDKAVEIFAQYASAWYLLGEIHRTRRLPDQAVSDYNQAIKCDPQYVSPYFGLALIALDRKQWDEVRSATEQVTRLNGVAYPMSYFYNAAANYNLGRLDAAEQSALKFQSLDTAHRVPDVQLLLAGILQARHDYPAAARHLREYLNQVPDSPRAAQIRADAERWESIGSTGQN
jgi:Tfp pilus assembly protein PilF